MCCTMQRASLDMVTMQCALCVRGEWHFVSLDFHLEHHCCVRGVHRKRYHEEVHVACCRAGAIEPEVHLDHTILEIVLSEQEAVVVLALCHAPIIESANPE